MEEILNSDECEEYRKNPPGTIPKYDEQFELRLSIAKKICEHFNKNDVSMSDEMREIYIKYPMWGFYVNKAEEDGDGISTCPRRSYGVCKYVDQTYGLHMVTAHIGWINDVVGGVEVSSVERIERWDENSIGIINLSNNPGVFLDPIGFMVPLFQQAGL